MYTSARASPILGERRRVRSILASSSGVNSRFSKSAVMAPTSSPDATLSVLTSLPMVAVRNASFTDYVIPTTLDMPDVTIAAFVEEPEPGAPYGAKGIGEPPTISSSAAIAAAVRAATGQDLPRIPIRPADIALG